MKIGILGGTFDPVHNAHLITARAALEQHGLDKVYIMTGGMPPHKKDSHVTDAVLRHKMVEIALEGDNELLPFGYEVNKPTYSYTSETLLSLKKEHPDWEIYFIIGEDSLRDIIKWHEPETILKNCVLLVYPRGSETDLDGLIENRRKLFNADIRKVDAPLIGISSTEIRKRVAEGKSIRYMVPDRVYEFIKENGLYR